MERNTDLEILKNDAIEAQVKAEVDVSITTAKKYPRDVKKAITNIEVLATQTEEVAQSCFYTLPRGGKKIQGESVRLAEIVATSWGNLNSGFRIISVDDKTITAQAIAHDLESNNRIAVECTKRITGKDGLRYNEDMIVMTGNAAGATAFRNAIFKVVPKALLGNLMEKIKDVAIGKGLDMETRRSNAISYFSKLGVQENEILELLDIEEISDIGKDELVTLVGLKNALTDGETTVEETFRKSSKKSKDPNKELQKAIEKKEKEVKEKDQSSSSQTKKKPGRPAKEEKGGDTSDGNIEGVTGSKSKLFE